ncbi:Putative antitoxin VapB45 [Dyadobacter sp. CECT 9623]|uniref:Antitoxin VapB45 n=1 Tax=Dyadobacter linearis TaxID=2823330 RepID=A0ABN7RIM0_9BACT|nr:DUF433 domain-containing protein [Dyadobacter sp. CECT 9623]CAG5073133.1 Putative antitoxin VapB45 [Dyadobacter sp. CECT 9623]
MNTENHANLIDIGTGIYTIADIASILNLPAGKVRRWMKEYWNAQFRSSDGVGFSEGSGRNLVTNFHTLIEFFIFYQLRSEGVSMQRIVKAHQLLANIFDTKYPFASSKVLTDGKQILFEGKTNEIIQADQTLQIIIKDIIEPFCKKIDFNHSELAERFYPLGKEHAIIVDPHRRFGQPLVGNSNILAETVHLLLAGGESETTIKNLYDLSSKEIRDVILFYQRAA